MKQLLEKLGYSDEDITKILDGMKEEKLYLTKEENIDERYGKLKEQKSDVDGQLDEANKVIKELKSSNGDNEALQATIKDHELTIKQLKSDSEEKIKSLIFDNAISSALGASGAKHIDLLAKKIDKSKLVVDEKGKVVGLDEQLKVMKESYSDLFTVQMSGKSPASPDTSISGVTKEQFDKMDYKQRVELFNTNKELYDSLTETKGD